MFVLIISGCMPGQSGSEAFTYSAEQNKPQNGLQNGSQDGLQNELQNNVQSYIAGASNQDIRNQFVPDDSESAVKPQITADQLVTDKTIERIALRIFPGGVEPAYFEVHHGSKVYLTITSMGEARGLAIPDLGINQLFEKDSPATIAFIADNRGEFSFFCSSNCEDRESMRGNIIIS